MGGAGNAQPVAVIDIFEPKKGVYGVGKFVELLGRVATLTSALFHNSVPMGRITHLQAFAVIVVNEGLGVVNGIYSEISRVSCNGCLPPGTGICDAQ